MDSSVFMKRTSNMNIAADDIRKAALKLIGDMAESAEDNGKFANGYILGVYDLAGKLTEEIENEN